MSDRSPFMNALFAMEGEDELVSLILVAKQSIAVPNSAANTLAVVSTSWIAML